MDVLISIGKDADPTNYIRAVERASGRATAVYLPRPGLRFDVLILAGGGDVEPSLYGQKNCGSTHIDPARDRAELALLRACARAGKPVLGICRGHQVINVWAGGGLIQDLGRQNEIHRSAAGDRIHPVLAQRGLPAETYGGCFRVNSAHHQAVGPVGKGLIVTACSDDGIVEAVEHRSLPVLGVQFHPERMHGGAVPDGNALLRRFLEKYCPRGVLR